MRDELGNRLKRNYENVSKTYLTRRMPVIIRLDGKAFHSFTKGFNKPFDDVFVDTMRDTAEYLCKNIQGCVFGYVQSDEISLLLVDYKNLNTDAWFNYGVQKCVSVAASMATMAFNKFFSENTENFCKKHIKHDQFNCEYLEKEDEKRYSNYLKSIEKGAVFDARIFNIPKEEVVNYFIWRQNDCYRNCINSISQCLFSQNEIFGKNTLELKELIGDKYDYEDWKLFGVSILKGNGGSTPTSVCVDDIRGMLNTQPIWNYCCFNFKENRNIIERTFIFNEG